MFDGLVFEETSHLRKLFAMYAYIHIQFDFSEQPKIVVNWINILVAYFIFISDWTNKLIYDGDQIYVV